MSITNLLISTRTFCRSLFNIWPVSDGRERAKSNLQKRLKFLTAVAGFDYHSTFYRTQVRRKYRYGDDACFVAKCDAAEVIGVADGVGGWRSYGIDPSQFSSQVMRTCAQIVNSGRFDPAAPVVLIQRSYDEVLNCKIPHVGSATVCLVSLNRSERCLHAANLGDSGFLVVRAGDVLARSGAPQQHAFNTPFQLASLPPRLQQGFHQDAPEAAAVSRVPVQTGDLVVVGTDGLFDNLSDQMILEEIRAFKNLGSTSKLQQCADRLVSKARSMWNRSDFVSPFAHEAQRHGYQVTGGKPGDVTVVLAFVSFDVIDSPTPVTSAAATLSNLSQQFTGSGSSISATH